MTYQERQQRIEEYLNSIAAVSSYYPDLVNLSNEIIDYVNDASKPLPTSPMPEDFYHLKQLLLVFAPLAEWKEEDERLFEAITMPAYWTDPNSGSGLMKSMTNYFDTLFFGSYLLPELRQNKTEATFQALLKQWDKTNFGEKELVTNLLNFSAGEHWYEEDGTLTPLAHFLVKSVKADESLLSLNPDHVNDQLFNLLLKVEPDFAERNVAHFLRIYKGFDELDAFNILVAEMLLNKNKEKYLPLVEELLPKMTSISSIYGVGEFFKTKFPEIYSEKKVAFQLLFLEQVRTQMFNAGASFYADFQIWDPVKRGYQSSFELMMREATQSGDERVFDCIVEVFGLACTSDYKNQILNAALAGYKERFLPIVFSPKGEFPSNAYNTEEYYPNLLKLLTTVDFQPYEAEVWAYTKNKSKRLRELAAICLAKLGERIIPETEKMLADKKAESRQTAALLLSLLRTDRANEILMNAIDAEKNDDARDTMLEAVAGLLPSDVSKEDLLEKVARAKVRGKLDKALDWWLDESKMPALHWKDTQEVIDSEVIRFLFYRMSRAKDIQTDREAKPLLSMIDRATSADFAKGLMTLYFDNGADAKFKFCLTLVGMLGDDSIIDLFKKKINEFAEGSRGKMAEYIVKALALQGSTRALRAVEFYSRKYKNKNKNIGAAAVDSFAIAAQELGITPYDLADTIIPNFDFDGIFRTFEVGDDSYRAFINTDFKLAFLNEDNKLMKSPPKGISQELADEFKEMGKEIKDIVKSQSGRLEQYLVIQRKWTVDKWQSLFMENPVMFAYAIRLVWGIFNDKNELVDTFICQQDQTLINEKGDEFELSEGLECGIVHPMSLSEAQIEYWTNALSDAGLEPIFPQLQRNVVALEEADGNVKISKKYQGSQVVGYSYVGTLEKLGWYRGSVIDGGAIASYFKDFAELGITAITTQLGGIGVGYLEYNAEIESVMFVKKGVVRFGNYVYDEPQHENDERLIAFKDVPTIVYSEVMSDMEALNALAAPL
ncbi:MAG: DUF4132 domain-containing protein [Spirosomataceae bacterium]